MRTLTYHIKQFYIWRRITLFEKSSIFRRKSQELFIFEDFLKIKNDEIGYVWDGYRSAKNVQSLFQLFEENSNYYKNIIHISLLRDFTLKDDPYSKERKTF